MTSAKPFSAEELLSYADDYRATGDRLIARWFATLAARDTEIAEVRAQVRHLDGDLARTRATLNGSTETQHQLRVQVGNLRNLLESSPDEIRHQLREAHTANENLRASMRLAYREAAEKGLALIAKTEECALLEAKLHLVHHVATAPYDKAEALGRIAETSAPKSAPTDTVPDCPRFARSTAECDECEARDDGSRCTCPCHKSPEKEPAR